MNDGNQEIKVLSIFSILLYHSRATFCNHFLYGAFNNAYTFFYVGQTFHLPYKKLADN